MKKSDGLSNEDKSQSCKLTTVVAASGVTIPNLLKDAGLFAVGPEMDDYKEQRFWARDNAAYYPVRGLNWMGTTNAGSFASCIDDLVTNHSGFVGFILYHFK